MPCTQDVFINRSDHTDDHHYDQCDHNNHTDNQNNDSDQDEA